MLYLIFKRVHKFRVHHSHNAVTRGVESQLLLPSPFTNRFHAGGNQLIGDVNVVDDVKNQCF